MTQEWQSYTYSDNNLLKLLNFKQFEINVPHNAKIFDIFPKFRKK